MTSSTPRARGLTGQDLPTPLSRSENGFTLFEVLIALAVFMFAVTGLAVALDTALHAALEVRQRSLCRSLLESRIAYCQADPPKLGTPRVLEASKNNGVRIEETLVPYPAKNGKGIEVTGLKKLTITTRSGNQSASAEILLNQP